MVARAVRITLREHRAALAANPNAYEADLPRTYETLARKLSEFGYRRVPRPLVVEIVEALFSAQGRRPLFHIEGDLPYCWNAPKDWGYDYIRYEWGHLNSRNQNADADFVENLGLSSARCNQHIQTSMDIAEVRRWLDGSAVARRIDEVLENRKRLFQSPGWIALYERLSACRPSAPGPVRKAARRLAAETTAS